MALPCVALGSLFTSLGPRSMDALACRMSHSSTMLGSYLCMSVMYLGELATFFLVSGKPCPFFSPPKAHHMALEPLWVVFLSAVQPYRSGLF